MPQLHCYVQEKLAKKLQDKARQAHLPVSKYLALLIEREVGGEWPEGYFDLLGAWEGDSLVRAEQGESEERVVFK